MRGLKHASPPNESALTRLFNDVDNRRNQRCRWRFHRFPRKFPGFSRISCGTYVTPRAPPVQESRARAGAPARDSVPPASAPARAVGIHVTARAWQPPSSLDRIPP